MSDGNRTWAAVLLSADGSLGLAHKRVKAKYYDEALDLARDANKAQTRDGTTIMGVIQW